MDIWEQVADQLDQYMDSEDTALAMIPTLFGVSTKATYLGLRAMGLTPAQSLQTIGLPPEYIDYWKDSDPAFLDFEFKHLLTIQKAAPVEIIKQGYYKNLALLVAKDATLIRRSMYDMDELSKREYDYLLKIRGHYTTAELKNLEQALNPEKHQSNLVINLNWGSDMRPQEVIEGVQVPYQLVEGGDNDTDRLSLHNPAQDDTVLPVPVSDQVLISPQG